MNLFFGTVMIIFGLVLFYAAQTKNESFIYRLLVERSFLKERVYSFHKVSAILIILSGLFYIFDLF
jgi:uncharacterized membrane protein